MLLDLRSTFLHSRKVLLHAFVVLRSLFLRNLLRNWGDILHCLLPRNSFFIPSRVSLLRDLPSRGVLRLSRPQLHLMPRWYSLPVLLPFMFCLLTRNVLVLYPGCNVVHHVPGRKDVGVIGGRVRPLSGGAHIDGRRHCLHAVCAREGENRSFLILLHYYN